MSNLRRPIVVVVGSLHYDIMVEAPDRPRKGETVTGFSWHPKFGGKGGNQAVAAVKAGAEVRMAGAVGNDEFGRFLLDALSAGGVDASYIAKLDLVGSGMSVATTDSQGDYGAVIVSGANAELDPVSLENEQLWLNSNVLVLQNEIPDAVNLVAAKAANRMGVPHDVASSYSTRKQSSGADTRAPRFQCQHLIEGRGGRCGRIRCYGR